MSAAAQEFGLLPPALAGSVLDGPFEGAAAVEGRIPGWLRGRLLRTAPAVFDFGRWSAAHWFDALGMVYSFDIGADGAVRWRQRLLECEFNRSVLGGRVTLACFGSRDQRTFLEAMLQPIPRPTDNANVNIVAEDGRWIAMTETARQLAIDPQSLRTVAELRFADALPRDLFTGAHPHYDFESREWINIGVVYGGQSFLVVFSQRHGAARTEIGRIPLRRVPYMHSFAVTRSKVVLVLPPYDLQTTGLLWSRRPIAEHYRWSPGAGTRVLLMDRGSGRTTLYTGDPCFFFHTVNAYDAADGATLLDLLVYPDAGIVDRLRMSAIRRDGLPALQPALRRFSMEPGSDVLRCDDPCGAAAFEFPSIHAARVEGRAHRYVWGTDLERLIRCDTVTGTVMHRSPGGATVGEPVFVGRPGGAEEDDGVLLTVGRRDAGGCAELAVWDAATLEVLARIRAPVALPLGFHGGFEPARLADGPRV